MASDSKKTKTDTAPKNDAAAKVKSTPAADASKSDGAKTAAEKVESTAAEGTSKPEGAETTAAAPSSYSRG
jgi:hypothetical protein